MLSYELCIAIGSNIRMDIISDVNKEPSIIIIEGLYSI